ncbi:Diphosphomevalonate decarboxylase [Wallemia mellicola CBS 633.66]|uniref:Diphosphomevalonate decarboxylase n=2 Tax=Wallemia mellicola TaxID=1708541 RepID=I4Y7B5_WALMC|nr:Diphosphomevalonate decarboxylase [Wallemia mellicola CBS 633.66]TIB71581.1 hypothetical protein E3Q24_02259 [Wallemia mellicola]EIM19857.1 Diphosphomevalonate decarboxylase [Wallemia mellicola CBS 633.66]TIB84162.1 Diphosphomevalonate decarboxylase [Wallemia mellicola]TIB87327.1 Diphosphomevalonate decarboxylase [Wallemia mellicola]TIB92240.1 Diphosphomevalonate decarboxylase [Wallemia mellicola]|eukprot:XP_006960000.1 Diphosphomevalonate decarboxylase [Wallemia mellicola CBS 633.66]
MRREITVTAPVNIAVIKYWGKRDVKLNLPTNSSLSVTLSQDEMCSKTTVSVDKSYTKDTLVLNGEENEINGRLVNVLNVMRESTTESEIKDLHVRIESTNNFPTAAGLASSASGFAALVYGLGKIFVPSYTNSQLSTIARQGSGSACRSLFGGFVAWNKGEKLDGSDSSAVEIAPQSHWDDLDALICVVSANKKAVASTAGMQRTVETSPYLQHRADNVVPKRMDDIIDAIKSKDFDKFADITMMDSNSFHASCLDTHPPIFYLTDVSRAIINVVHALNNAMGRHVAAYTFDAGPNAVLYVQRKDKELVLSIINSLFGPCEGVECNSLDNILRRYNIDADLSAFQSPNGLSRIIQTSIGDGPRIV